MTTRFEDFSGYSAGAFSTVGAAHWTVLAETGAAWTRTVTANANAAGTGNALVFNNNGNGDAEQIYYSPTPGSTTTDIEVLAYLKWAGGKDTGSSGMGGAILVTSAGTSYTVRRTTGTTWQLARYSATGGLSAGLGTATDIGIAGTANVYHWIRLGRASTDSLRAKVWTGAIGDEPGSWQLTATDTALTTLYGGIGVHSYPELATIDILSIGIGEAAPSSPGSGGGGPSIPTLAHATIFSRRRR